MECHGLAGMVCLGMFGSVAGRSGRLGVFGRGQFGYVPVGRGEARQARCVEVSHGEFRMGLARQACCVGVGLGALG